MNRFSKARRCVLGVGSAFLFATAACDSPVVQGPPSAAAGRAGSRPGSRADQAANPDQPASATTTAAGTRGTEAADSGVASRPPPLPLNDNEFAESDRARDPFRSFAQEFVPVGPQVTVNESSIRLREYALDELRLVAVILGTGNPYAMLVDPTGRGTIVRRGDYVGRPDTVAGGTEGSMPHQVPWRLARIVGSRVSRDARDNNLTEVPGEVVFEREDRLNPTASRSERAITLTPGAQATRAGGGAGTESGAIQPAFPPLQGLGGGSPFLPSAIGPQTGATTPPGAPPGTFVQSYTTVIPPAPAPPAQAPTVIIQTGPQGQTTVTPAGQQQHGTPAPQGPRDPYLPPPGGSNAPPPVEINSGPSGGNPGLPSSGLPRQ